MMLDAVTITTTREGAALIRRLLLDHAHAVRSWVDVPEEDVAAEAARDLEVVQETRARVEGALAHTPALDVTRVRLQRRDAA